MAAKAIAATPWVPDTRKYGYLNGNGLMSARPRRLGREHVMPKGSDLLVQALENEGVDRIIGIPGEENLDVEELRAKVKNDGAA